MNVCFYCVGDPGLKELIHDRVVSGRYCDSCDTMTETTAISHIAKAVSKVLEIFYAETSNTISVKIYGRPPAGDDLQTVVKQLLKTNDEVVDAVIEELQANWNAQSEYDRPFDDIEDLWLKRVPTLDSVLLSDWQEMEVSLRRETRYVNPKAISFLDKIFGDVGNASDSEGTPVITTAGPGTKISTLYRARVFQSERELLTALHHPEKNLGAPPEGVSLGGRMNAAGLPTFYGSLDPKTATAEVRPPVGSWVAVAPFTIIRPLYLLDLSKLEDTVLKVDGSLFDEQLQELLKKRAFLSELSRRMVLPVLPNDEKRSYLITQVIADYLATHSAKIDGLAFRSVQRGLQSIAPTVNVVLFSMAAGAIGADVETETAVADLYVDDDDGNTWSPYICYHTDDQEPAFGHFPFRSPALRLVRDGIELHRVKSIAINSDIDRFSVVRPEDLE